MTMTFLDNAIENSNLAVYSGSKVAAPGPEQSRSVQLVIEMTNINSSNKDIDFPIPDKTCVYYQNEFASAMSINKHNTLMLPDNVKYVGIGLLKFDKKVLKYIIDSLPTTPNFTKEQRDDLLLRTKSISCVQNTEMSTNSGLVESETL